MLELGDKFQHSHQRQLTELELVRHSAMRDSSELLGADRSVAIQNLSLYAEGEEFRTFRCNPSDRMLSFGARYQTPPSMSETGTSFRISELLTMKVLFSRPSWASCLQ